ncbi:hypothetical protein F4X90_20325 [Candidatus Poribacteria bacterium]|nr:hypothetical protein [Candidatus Poribacteria bacterium]
MGKEVTEMLDKAFEPMEALFQKLQEEHAEVVAKLEHRIRTLEQALDATGMASTLLAYQDHATAANMTLDEWVVRTLDNAVKYNSIPVSNELYKRLCAMAGAKGKSLVMFIQQNKKFDALINQALDNKRF